MLAPKIAENTGRPVSQSYQNMYKNYFQLKLMHFVPLNI